MKFLHCVVEKEKWSSTRMSRHLSSVGKAYDRGFAIKDKPDTESEWYERIAM